MPGMIISPEAVHSGSVAKIRKLLRKVGLRLSLVDYAPVTRHITLSCVTIRTEGNVYFRIDETLWQWLQPVLEELVELRKAKIGKTRIVQDVVRDTLIMEARDRDKMLFTDIASVYNISPARVRALYIRRKAQQASNKQKVRLHVNFSGVDVARAH